jgi:acyl dehydratase
MTAHYDIAAYSIVKKLGLDVDDVGSISARFSTPVYPGETLRTEMWRDGPVISFRVRCVERDVIAINNGCLELRAIRRD